MLAPPWDQAMPAGGQSAWSKKWSDRPECEGQQKHGWRAVRLFSGRDIGILLWRRPLLASDLFFDERTSHMPVLIGTSFKAAVLLPQFVRARGFVPPWSFRSLQCSPSVAAHSPVHNTVLLIEIPVKRARFVAMLSSTGRYAGLPPTRSAIEAPSQAPRNGECAHFRSTGTGPVRACRT